MASLTTVLPRRMRIVLTQEDIDKGKRNACGDCPFALAIKRIVGSEPFVFYGFSKVYGFDGRPVAVYLNSPRMGKWISEFDRNGQGKPGVFYATRSIKP